MQDTILIYTDFIITTQRLYTILNNLFKVECKDLITNDITVSQLLYLYYLSSHGDISCMDDKKYNKKNFYYTIKKLTTAGYIKIYWNHKNINHIALTEKGKIIKTELDKVFEIHAKKLCFNGMLEKELSHILTLIYRFEKFWINIITEKEKKHKSALL